MKLLRITVFVIFTITLASFAVYRGYEVKHTDLSGPEIQYGQEGLQVSVEASKEDLLRGVTAFDAKDKDVTDSLLIEAISDFVSSGKRYITYAAVDSNNNVTRRERELTYTDYVPPQFTILKPLRFAAGAADDITGYLRVQDCIDGDITDQVKFDQPDYYYGFLSGVYQIDFRVTNSAGDTVHLTTDVEFY